jgi:hypothetical protein
MKLPIKIVLINVSLLLLYTFLARNANDTNHGIMFFQSFGFASLIVSPFLLFAGAFLLIAKDRQYSQGFFLSSGFIFLLGFLCCSSFGLH